MNGDLVVIFTEGAEIDEVAAELSRRKMGCAEINHALLSENVRINQELGGSFGTSVCLGDDEWFDVSRVTSVWVRSWWAERDIGKRADVLGGRGTLPDDALRFLSREWKETMYGLFNALSEAHWVSPFDALLRGSVKPHQLEVARNLGLAIPDTIMTNNEGDIERFGRRRGDSCLAMKAFHTGVMSLDPDDEGHFMAIYTNRVRLSDLDLTPSVVRTCPTILQQEISKREKTFVCSYLEIRCFRLLSSMTSVQDP